MTSRETFDLFTKWGRHNFFRSGIFGAKWSRYHVLKDTFGHHICAVLGHSDKTWETEDKATVCERCNKRIQSCQKGD